MAKGDTSAIRAEWDTCLKAIERRNGYEREANEMPALLSQSDKDGLTPITEHLKNTEGRLFSHCYIVEQLIIATCVIYRG